MAYLIQPTGWLYGLPRLEWQAEIFVSSDERQIKAAIKSGLNVDFIEGFKPES